MNNPIIQEIREARAALAAEHGYDLARINEWARQQTLARQAAAKKEAGNKRMAEPAKSNGSDSRTLPMK